MAVTIKARHNSVPIPPKVVAQFPGETAGGYFNHVYRLNRVLQNMSNRGIPISEEKLDQMAVDLANEREKLLLQVQELIKERGEGKEKLFSYGEKDFYLTLPKVLRQWCKDKGEVRIEDKRRKNKETGKMEMTKVEVEYPFNPFLNEMKYGTASLKEVDKEFYDYSIEEGFEWVERHEGSTLVARIVAGKQFNPESPQQVMMYCKWMSYEIPTAMKKTSLGKEEKETTDDAALEELWKKTKDPMFQLIQEIRGNNKLAKTYVSGWRSNRADGRLHSTYTFRPATGQLSSTAPNVQNPHPIIKTAVVATAGRVLVECDYSGYHAQLLGYFAGDREYMKLATLGLHDYLAAHILRSKISNMKATEFNSNKQLWLETSQHLSTLDSWLTLPDTELGEKLHWIKKNHKEVRNKQAKPAVHGIGFGMGVKKLYDMNKGSFASLKEAESIRNIMVKLFPKVFKFQAMIVEKAHKEKKLVSPYGFVRRFWEAKIWRNGQMVNGEDAEKIIAFLPANTAFSIKKEAMLRLEEKGANYKYRLVNEVHDSLVYEVDEGDLEEMMEVVTREMTRPVMRLANEMFPEGFIPVVEVKVGKSWDKMEVVG